jgi:hypothetical protein
MATPTLATQCPRPKQPHAGFTSRMPVTRAGPTLRSVSLRFLVLRAAILEQIMVQAMMLRVLWNLVQQ